MKNVPSEQRTAQAMQVCIVGGRTISRQALASLLREHEIDVRASYHDLDALLSETERLAQEAPPCVLLVMTGRIGAFGLFRDIQRTLINVGEMPLVVLADRPRPSHARTALRLGAKGYLCLDCPCEELVRTLREAARGEVYLPPEVSNMLAHDETRPEHKRERIWDLSPRELQIVQLISEGLSSREVAARLHISPKTVENHRYNIYRKCDVDNVSGLIRHAFSRGLVEI